MREGHKPWEGFNLSDTESERVYNLLLFVGFIRILSRAVEGQFKPLNPGKGV
jgi:hypothetical protein